jgi:hypothetical protein
LLGVSPQTKFLEENRPMKKQCLLWAFIILISGVFVVPKTGFTRDDKKDDRHHLAGRWYMNGDRNKPADIHENGRGLEATNENGQTSRLEISRNGDVRALDWHGIRGKLRGNRIEWDNDTTWTRKPSERVGRR